jgi:hypothetical protein
MKQLRIRETGSVVDRKGLLRAFPNVSFPKGTISQSSLNNLGVDEIHPGARPSVGAYQTVSLGAPVQKDDGLWYENWVVNDMFTDTTEDGVTTTKEEHEAANDAELAADIASRVRSERDALLAQTDWWASTDLTMTQAQTDYRQALRDITSHANWPNLADSDWPVAS